MLLHSPTVMVLSTVNPLELCDLASDSDIFSSMKYNVSCFCESWCLCMLFFHLMLSCNKDYFIKQSEGKTTVAYCSIYWESIFSWKWYTIKSILTLYHVMRQQESEQTEIATLPVQTHKITPLINVASLTFTALEPSGIFSCWYGAALTRTIAGPCAMPVP